MVEVEEKIEETQDTLNENQQSCVQNNQEEKQSEEINQDSNQNQEKNPENKEEGKHKKSKKKAVIITLISLILLAVAAFVYIYFFQYPIVSYNGNEDVIVQVGKEYNDKGINAYTRFKSINDKVIIEGNVDTSKIGKYVITYKVPYLAGYKEYKRRVTVVDEEAPEIELDGGEDYILEYGKEYVDPGYHAKDNYDGDITEKVETKKIEVDDENFDIKYTVKDSSGNSAKALRHVKILDTEAPKITLKGNQVVSVILGNKYQDNGVTVIDNKDGDISTKIKVSGDVDTSKEGTYLVKYYATDSSGNSSEEHRKVIVNSVEKAGIIYLTIDDGPSTTITPQILDILKEKGVHATFFITNYSDATESLIKRELDEGNAIGIHGYSHNYEEIYSSVDACYENIKKLQDKIYNSTGKTIKIVRFPGGSSNTISKNYCEGVMTEISQKILDEGYIYFDWNVDSGDAGGAKTKEQVFENVTSALQHGRSNIVLMHDFSGNNKTLEALPEIIDYGLENGYVFDIIKDNTPMVTHTILN